MARTERPDGRIKDLAAILRTVACVEALLAHAHQTPYGWEKHHYGSRRRGYGEGHSTRGSMARSRSAQHAVSPDRLAEWDAECEAVTRVRYSPVWKLLRPADLKPSTFPPFDRLHGGAYWTLNRKVLIPGIESMPLPADLDAVQRLAGLGTLDAVAALLMLIVEKQAEDPELAIERGRYLPPALALLAQTPEGSRTAFLMLARFRQTTLDDLYYGDHRIVMHDYDFPAVVASGREIVRTRVIKDSSPVRRGNYVTRIDDATVDWLTSHRPRIGPRKRRSSWPWNAGLGPKTHSEGVLHPSHVPRYHPRAVARIVATLSRYAH